MARAQQHRVSYVRAGWKLIALLSLIAGALIAPHTQAQPHKYEIADLRALQDAFVRLAEQVRPGVVALRTYRTADGAPAHVGLVTVPLSHGTGFVIHPEGLILTNRHVLENAQVVLAILHDGSEHTATLQQSDIRSDLAVLKIETSGLTPVRWGVADEVKVNQWAFACGNPFGLAVDQGQSSITFGVVSAVGRRLTDRLARDRNLEYYDNLIETSAAINPGGSGGPLFKLEGEVIGIITAIESSTGLNEGVGFAIPVDNYTRRIVDTLAAGRSMRYGYLGVTVTDNTPPRSRIVARLQPEGGARVVNVETGTPAANAGLRRNDLLLEFNGTEIRGRDHLVRLVSMTPIGQEVPVLYQRGLSKRHAVVTVGDRFELLGYEQKP